MGYEVKYKHLERLLPSLVEAEDNILQKWSSSEQTHTIYLKRGIVSSDITNSVAKLLLSGVFDLVEQTKELQHTYDTEVLVRYFADHQLEIDEVFILYMNLQHQLVEYIFEDNTMTLLETKNILYELNEIFEYSLVTIINLFSDLKRELIVAECIGTTSNLYMCEDYKTVVDQVSAIIVTDTKGFITFVNDKFCELSGYTRDKLLSSTASIVRHLDTPASVFTQMWNTLNSKNTWIGQFKNLNASGSAYHVNSVITPILDSDGEIRELVSIQHDITREKEEENERTKSYQEDENKRLTRFIDAQGSELVTTIPLPSFIINNENVIIEYNDAFVDLFNVEIDSKRLSDLKALSLNFTSLLNKQSMNRFNAFTEDWITLYNTLYINEPLIIECEVDFLTQQYEVKWSQFKGVKTLACLVRI